MDSYIIPYPYNKGWFVPDMSLSSSSLEGLLRPYLPKKGSGICLLSSPSLNDLVYSRFGYSQVVPTLPRALQHPKLEAPRV